MSMRWSSISRKSSRRTSSKKHSTTVLICVTLVSCSKPRLLQNQTPINNVHLICILLAERQPDYHYIWSYHSFTPEEKSDIMYYFNISDYLPISEICSNSHVTINEIDVADRYLSTSGPKGEAVSEFNIKANISFHFGHGKIENKVITVSSRTPEYNWVRQKTIRALSSNAFSRGMNRLYEEIVKHTAVL